MAEDIGIRLRLDGVREAMAQAQSLQTTLNGMDGKTYTPRVAVAQKQFQKAISDTAESIAKERVNWDSLTDAEKKQVQNAQKIVAQARATKKAITDTSKAITAQKDEFKQLAKGYTSAFSNFGSKMQSLGHGLQSITAPFTKLFTGVAYGVGMKALSTATQGLNDSLSRYDTMKTYSRIMEKMGVSATQAQKGVEKLNDSVVGLPTGLDEIVGHQRIFYQAMKDYDKSVNFAIAANNALVAGGADAKQTTEGYRQLRNMLSKGKLDAKQWDSLLMNMNLGIQYAGEQLGYTGKKSKQFINDLKDGTVSVEKFTNALIAAGTGDNSPLKLMADEMKNTAEGLQANVKNAFSRMGAGILVALDEVFTGKTGKDFIEAAKSITKGIDGITESAKNWITNNPDKIIGFFNDLKSIDWGGMVSGVAQGIGGLAKFFTSIGKMIGGETLGKFMIWGNILGKAMVGIGSIIKGLSPILAGIGARIKLGVLQKFFSKLPKLFSGLKLAEKSAKGLGGLTALQTIFGKGGNLKDVLTNVRWTSNRLEALEGLNKMASTLGKFQLANKALNIAAIPAIAWSLKKAAEGLKVLGDVEFSPDLAWKVTTVVTAMTTMLGAVAGIGTLLSSSKIAMIGAGVATGAMMGISKSIDWLASGAKKASEAVKMVSDMELPSMDKVKGVVKRAQELTKAFKTNNPLQSIAKMIDAFSMGTQADAVKKVADSMKSISDLAKSKLSKKAMKKAVSASSQVMDFSDDIIELFNQEDEKLMKGATTQAGKKGQAAAGKKYKSYTWIKSQMRDYADTVESLSDGLKFMTQTMKRAQKLQSVYDTLTSESQENPLDWSIVKDRIGKLADGLYGLMDANENSALDKLVQVSNKLKGTKFQNVTSMFKEIPKMLNAMRDAYNEIIDNDMLGGGNTASKKDLSNPSSWFGKGMDIEKSPLTKLVDQVGEIMKSIGEMKESIPEDTGDLKESMSAVSESMTSLKSIFTALGVLTSGELTGGKPLDTKAVEGISTIMTEFSKGLSSLSTAFSEMGDVSKFGKKMNALNDSVMTPFTDIFNKLIQIQTSLNEAGGDTTGGAGAGIQTSISTQILDLMTAFRTINSTIAELGDMGKFTGNMSMLDVAMNYLKNVFVKLSDIQGLMGGAGGTGAGELGASMGAGFGSIGATIKQIINDIAEACMQAPVLMVQATMLQAAFLSLQNAFNTLNTISTTVQTAANTITTSLNTLQAIGTQIINISITITGTVDDGGIPAKIQSVADKINNALANIKMTYPKSVVVNVKGKVNDGGVPSKINAVATSIRTAFNNIPTNLSKQVTVNITGSVNKSGVFPHTGGYINDNGKLLYRSKGGFTPKGTDIVPAMLTPGEYVIRKQAVRGAGVDLLQKINHMDWGGALRALSVKAGQNILPKTGTVINNNRVTNNNNNAKVTINNQSSNGSVGLGMANRFVNAL